MTFSNYDTGMDSVPAETVAPVSPITLALVFMLFVVAAMACTLGAYYVSLQQSNALQAAGFIHWPGSANGYDNILAMGTMNDPGANVWYRFQSNSALTFEFLSMPLPHAVECGLAVLSAGLLGAVAYATARVQIGPPVLGAGLMALGALGLGI